MGQRIDLTQQVQNVLPESQGGAGPNIGLRFSDAETPAGSINGSNQSFTLAFSPFPTASMLLFLNKVLQIQGADYTLSANVLSMSAAPSGSPPFLAWYRYLGFGQALSFRDGLSIADGFAINAPVAKIPLGLFDSLLLSDTMVFDFPPTMVSGVMTLTQLVVLGYGDQIADTEVVNWKESVLKIMSPSRAEFGDAMTISDGFTHS